MQQHPKLTLRDRVARIASMGPSARRQERVVVLLLSVEAEQRFRCADLLTEAGLVDVEVIERALRVAKQDIDHPRWRLEVYRQLANPVSTDGHGDGHGPDPDGTRWVEGLTSDACDASVSTMSRKPKP